MYTHYTDIRTYILSSINIALVAASSKKLNHSWEDDPNCLWYFEGGKPHEHVFILELVGKSAGNLSIIWG